MQGSGASDCPGSDKQTGHSNLSRDAAASRADAANSACAGEEVPTTFTAGSGIGMHEVGVSCDAFRPASGVQAADDSSTVHLVGSGPALAKDRGATQCGGSAGSKALSPVAEGTVRGKSLLRGHAASNATAAVSQSVDPGHDIPSCGSGHRGDCCNYVRQVPDKRGGPTFRFGAPVSDGKGGPIPRGGWWEAPRGVNRPFDDKIAMSPSALLFQRLKFKRRRLPTNHMAVSALR